MKTPSRVAKILDSLATAYGGHSQYRLDDVGRAIAGHIANAGLAGNPVELADEAAEILADIWADGGREIDADEILAAIEDVLDPLPIQPHY